MMAYYVITQVVMWTLILGGIFTKDYSLIPLGWAVGLSVFPVVLISGRLEFGSWTWWRY